MAKKARKARGGDTMASHLRRVLSAAPGRVMWDNDLVNATIASAKKAGLDLKEAPVRTVISRLKLANELSYKTTRGKPYRVRLVGAPDAANEPVNGSPAPATERLMNDITAKQGFTGGERADLHIEGEQVTITGKRGSRELREMCELIWRNQ